MQQSNSIVHFSSAHGDWYRGNRLLLALIIIVWLTEYIYTAKYRLGMFPYISAVTHHPKNRGNLHYYGLLEVARSKHPRRSKRAKPPRERVGRVWEYSQRCASRWRSPPLNTRNVINLVIKIISTLKGKECLDYAHPQFRRKILVLEWRYSGKYITHFCV